MLTRYRRQFHHDRRRIALVGALTLTAGTLRNGLLPDPLPVASEILLVPALMVAIPLFTSHARSWRHWIEIAAIGYLVVALFRHLLPAGFFGWHDLAFLLGMQIPAGAGLLLGLHTAIYGAWSDRRAPRRCYRKETTLRTALPTRDLWVGLVPTPGFADRNPDREIVSIEFADAAKSNVRLTTWIPPRAGTGEVQMTIRDITAFRHIRFELTVLRGLRTPGLEGEFELFFEDRGSHRVVHLRHRIESLTPRCALLSDFDDTFGRMMTARLNAVETRAATGRATKTATDFNSWFEHAGRSDPVLQTEIAGYRTAYGRQRSADETAALETLGGI